MQILLFGAIGKSKLGITACLLLVAGIAFAQDGYESAGIIYRKGTFSVELQYKLSSSCNRLSFYKLFMRGSVTNQNQFLNWRFSYYNCSGNITVESVSFHLSGYEEEADGSNIENMNYSFAGKKLYQPFIDVIIDDQQYKTTSYQIQIPISKRATGIKGNTTIDYGEQTILQKEGGLLGDPTAKWRWYKNRCGETSVGEGETIMVKPTEKTSYFVRAESIHGNTECATITVHVDQNSRAADSISGNTSVCVENSVTKLSREGGNLGRAAEWTWYADSLGGKPIGTGTTIEVKPRRKTVYFVRAESAYNITAAKSVLVRVTNERSTAPTSVTGDLEVCEGNIISLTAHGGKLSTDARYVWYKNDPSSGNKIAYGSTLSMLASKGATFYVRAEGACNTTTAISTQVKVATPSKAASGIIQTAYEVYRGQKVQLNVRDGILGDNSDWVWSNARGRNIGRGNVIKLRPHRTTSYSVKAQSECFESESVATQINVHRRFVFVNVGIIPSLNSASIKNDITSQFSNVTTAAIANGNYSLTIGKVKRSGWYLRAKYSLHTEIPEYETTSTGLINYNAANNYYSFNGEKQERRIAGTLGALLAVSPKTFLLSIGAGYGERTLSWGLDIFDYQSGKKIKSSFAGYQHFSVKGVEGEIGLMLKAGFINLMFGGNVIIPLSSNKTSNSINHFIDGYAGFGFNF